MGIDLDVEVLRPRQMFPRTLDHKEFDASELSMASLAGLIGRGDRSFIGIPVMLSKIFRHSCIYVRTDEVFEPLPISKESVSAQRSSLAPPQPYS